MIPNAIETKNLLQWANKRNIIYYQITDLEERICQKEQKIIRKGIVYNKWKTHWFITEGIKGYGVRTNSQIEEKLVLNIFSKNQ